MAHSSQRLPDDYKPVQKKDDKSSKSSFNSTFNFIEKRKTTSSKSPPNPFMSRINISSFLNLMVAEKGESNIDSKKTKNIDRFLVNTRSKSSKELSELTENGVSNGDQSASSQCPVCANELSSSLMHCHTNCNHYACIDCWQHYVINRIENYEIAFGFTCLTCANELQYHKVINILKEINDIEYRKRMLQKLEMFLLDRALQQDQNYRRCPNPGCEYAFYLVPKYKGCKDLKKCQLKPGCKGQLCRGSCTKFWVTLGHHDCKYQQSHLPSTSASPLSDDTGLSITKTDLDEPLSNPGIQRHGNWATACFPWLRRSNKNKKSVNKTTKKNSSKVHDERASKSLKNKENNRRFHGKSQVLVAENNTPTTSGTSSSNNTSPFHRSVTDDNVSLGSFKSNKSRKKVKKLSDQGDGEIKMCPKCHTFVLKMNDGSCNHMVCIMCGCEFCWLCMRQITDMHYLSPSGCTFWGRRQWNAEKRALWQLGTLIGAPVAIGFLAALAIPAMVIGIPLFVGRKIHGALKCKNKEEKRTIAILGGIGAFIVSPVIAAIAVGLGVPLILAYVYVVMPIALCRASACSCDEGPPSDSAGNQQDHENNEVYLNNLLEGNVARGGIRRPPSPDPFSSFLTSSDNKGDQESHSPIQLNKPIIHQDPWKTRLSSTPPLYSYRNRNGLRINYTDEDLYKHGITSTSSSSSFSSTKTRKSHSNKKHHHKNHSANISATNQLQESQKYAARLSEIDAFVPARQERILIGDRAVSQSVSDLAVPKKRKSSKSKNQISASKTSSIQTTSITTNNNKPKTRLSQATMYGSDDSCHFSKVNDKLKVDMNVDDDNDQNSLDNENSYCGEASGDRDANIVNNPSYYSSSSSSSYKFSTLFSPSSSSILNQNINDDNIESENKAAPHDNSAQDNPIVSYDKNDNNKHMKLSNDSIIHTVNPFVLI